MFYKIIIVDLNVKVLDEGVQQIHILKTNVYFYT